MRAGFQVKRPKCPPAMSLVGRIGPDVMLSVLRELDNHTAGRWEIARTGRNRTDGDYFVVRYWRTDSGPHPYGHTGAWEMVFGLDGSLWMD